jgi:hypothetical protein
MCQGIVRIIFLLLLGIYSLSDCAANIPTSPLHNNNNNTQNFNPSPSWHTEIKPNIYVTASAIIDKISIRIEQISITIWQTITETITKKNAALLKDLIKLLLWENRYKIAGGTVFCSYGAANALLCMDYYYLCHNMVWAHWKHKKTFEELCAIPQKDLARELLLSIGQHHYNKDNPTDLAYPLITFIKHIDWEIDIIKRYIRTTKTIKKIALTPFFATNERKLERATRALQRAVFIKHIFLSWLADYNLASTEKMNI